MALALVRGYRFFLSYLQWFGNFQNKNCRTIVYVKTDVDFIKSMIVYPARF